MFFTDTNGKPPSGEFGMKLKAQEAAINARLKALGIRSDVALQSDLMMRLCEAAGGPAVPEFSSEAFNAEAWLGRRPPGRPAGMTYAGYWKELALVENAGGKYRRLTWLGKICAATGAELLGGREPRAQPRIEEEPMESVSVNGAAPGALAAAGAAAARAMAEELRDGAELPAASAAQSAGSSESEPSPRRRTRYWPLPYYDVAVAAGFLAQMTLNLQFTEFSDEDYARATKTKTGGFYYHLRTALAYGMVEHAGERDGALHVRVTDLGARLAAHANTSPLVLGAQQEIHEAAFRHWASKWARDLGKELGRDWSEAALPSRLRTELSRRLLEKFGPDGMADHEADHVASAYGSNLLILAGKRGTGKRLANSAVGVKRPAAGARRGTKKILEGPSKVTTGGKKFGAATEAADRPPAGLASPGVRAREAAAPAEEDVEGVAYVGLRRSQVAKGISAAETAGQDAVYFRIPLEDARTAPARPAPETKVALAAGAAEFSFLAGSGMPLRLGEVSLRSKKGLEAFLEWLMASEHLLDG